MLLVSQKILILKYNIVNFSESLLPTPTLNVNTVNLILLAFGILFLETHYFSF